MLGNGYGRIYGGAVELYSYYRSSASYRVRIALHYKGLAFSYRAMDLLRWDEASYTASYRAKNAQALLPALLDDGQLLTQSLSIMEYLEEKYPQPPLLPRTPVARARVRAIAGLIACEMHPLNNLRVLKYLTQTLKIAAPERQSWYQHWIMEGFAALEATLAQSSSTGRCCYGNEPSMADMCLVPQVYNAKRYHCSLNNFPIIGRINDYCLTLPAFAQAAPDVQPDAIGQ